MDIILINRTSVTGASGPTFGTISLNGKPIGVTLEPAFTSGQLMSPGTYGAFLRNSTKSNRTVIELKNTYPRTHIQLHIGSVVGDTKGCILVGSRRAGNEIRGSRDTMHHILDALLSRPYAPLLQVIIL